MNSACTEQLMAETTLPDNCHWYEVNGQRVFAMYGVNGCIAARFYACIVREEGKFLVTRPAPEALYEVEERPKFFGSGLLFDLCDIPEEIKAKIARALAPECFVEFNADGGALPMPRKE